MRFCVCSAVVGLLQSAVASAQPVGFDLQAHRGGRGETTESSLPAFAKSLELGVTTLEFDIVLTKDRQPLVWHDPVVEPGKCVDTEPAFESDPQYPYVGKRIRDVTLRQIRTLDCGLPLAEFPDAEVLRGNTIATLPEVFELADSYRNEVRFNIEAKVEPGDAAEPGPQEFVDVVLAAVRSAGRMDRIEIQSFDWRILPLVRRAEPSIPLVALWEAGSDPIRGAVAVGANVIAPEYSFVDAEFVNRAHTVGLKVVPWTVNDADAMRAQIGAGVDGMITDYPSRLRAVMAELGMPLPPPATR